jgi:SAM-dependent methyltransferase
LGLAGVSWLLASTPGFSRPAQTTVRNFYGVLRIGDVDTNTEMPRRRLAHGSINHGEQFLAADLRHEPTAYYGRRSGVGLAILESRREGPQRVGVIGLGAGVLASYGRSGDYYRFYEINPLVVNFARTEFSFLADTQARCDIVLGDARLSLEREPPQEFDVLAVDAFSGDAIPVHLLTREAVALYFRHLRPDGILALHVSSKYLDLASIAGRAARDLGKQTLVITDLADYNSLLLRSSWVLAGDSGGRIEDREVRQAGAGAPALRPVRAWTDDYSYLLGLLR